MYAVDVDPADSSADDAGEVVHVDSMARAGVGIFGLPAFIPPVKVDEMVDKGWMKRMDRINTLFDSTMGISYAEGPTLSVRFLRDRLERFLLYGFVLICWV